MIKRLLAASILGSMPDNEIMAFAIYAKAFLMHRGVESPSYNGMYTITGGVQFG